MPYFDSEPPLLRAVVVNDRVEQLINVRGGLHPAILNLFELAGVKVKVVDSYGEVVRLGASTDRMLPEHKVDEEVWRELNARGYELPQCVPEVVVRVEQGGQWGKIRC